MVVNEDNGTATVCLEKDRVTAEPLTVEVRASEEEGIDNPANGMFHLLISHCKN